MGYSTSRETLEKMLPDLELLRQGKQCIWTVEPGVKPSDFAYKVREALYIARLYPQSYPELARAADIFRIEIVNKTQVQARLARGTTAAALQPLTPGAATAIMGLEDAGIAKKMMGPQTATSIIQTWLDVQPSNDKLYFPEANLSFDEKVKLNQFLRTKKWLMFVDEQGAVTVQRYQSGVADFAWSPEER